MKILAIETSCDETACAIVEDGTKELASSIASSADLHEKTGGVVPEVAARKQVESIVPVIEECIKKSDLAPKTEIDAIAVTAGPGLIGALLVGVEAAKTLALTWDKPLIPVNHLIGHIYANFVHNNLDEGVVFPALVLVVSGGHTDLVLMRGHGAFEYVGGTIDDAAGEAFDKVARLLGISKYLGGVKLSQAAATCTNNTLAGRLPRPLLDRDNYDFSFSGLKTAVRRLVEQENHPVNTVACEFENAVVDVLVDKTMKAAKKHKVASIMLGGGVSANTQLRTRLSTESDQLGVALHLPPLNLCGDNAIYIASAAFFNNKPVDIAEVVANPSLGILD